MSTSSIKIDTEILEAVARYCIKHGKLKPTKKAVIEQAILEYIEKKGGKYEKNN